ncbi:MAG: TIM44-like domain-containing protein [bacterium]|nr:TIM44-like domain-containing protein [bacterium]
MNELINLDPTFTLSSFKSKVDNIFVMLHMALMTDNMKRVDHFINDDVYNIYNNRLIELNNNNERQMFDELNVKSTDIENVEIKDDKYVITVNLVSRYMNYIVDKNTGDYKRGNNTSRVERQNILTFEKKRNAKIQQVVRFCPNCGHPLDVNKSGYCEFCHSIYNQEDYDWVLTDIKTW